MSENERNIGSHHRKDHNPYDSDSNLAAPVSGVSSVAGSVKHYKQQASSSERQIKFEKAQKCLENAVLVSKRIKEHRKATAELLGRPFEEDVTDTASELGTTMSERTGYSVSTEASTLSVQDALNIPGISESLANTLKQKEILMERIKQYKEINKRPTKKTTPTPTRGLPTETADKKASSGSSSDGTDVSKLMSLVKEKENSLSVMQVKMKAMENTILDLQEKVTEKDQIIEAKNRATTLISDSLSKKERETLDLLEDTKEQMTKMQSNFIAMETEWKEERQKLLNELSEKNNAIKSLEEANTILENARFEVSVENSKLSEELELRTKEIVSLQDKLQQLTQTCAQEAKDNTEAVEEKGSIEINNMEELTKKVELLEQINFEIRQTNKELESQLATLTVEAKPVVSPAKRGSPLPTRKGGRSTASKMKSPWSQLSSESLPQEQDKKAKPDKTKTDMLLQSLNKEILDKEYVISEKNIQITELENIIRQKETRINELQSSMDDKVPEKADAGMTTDDAVETVRGDDSEATLTVSELQHKLKSAEDTIATLSAEIDTANKNMIKVKSNSKLKLKQMQKTIDNFSKVSDANAEIVKLNEEIHLLTQRVAELEVEKGNLQLHLVDYDSGRLTESDVYKKLIEMENVAEARLTSISLLETQKFDLVQELHSLQQKNLEMEDKLADISQLQSEQVSSEMKSVQLEEQIDSLMACKKELELVIDNLKLDKNQLEATIKSLQDEKDELAQKLENCIQENIELADKLGKLSAEKVSSAESIEIVESLTSQEKLELEEYSKGLQTEQKTKDGEYKDSGKHDAEACKEKLLEEIVELKNRIELFTVERQEVMERMSKLSTDNETLNESIAVLKEQCETLKLNIDSLDQERNQLVMEKEDLNRQLEELKQEKSDILKETADVVKSSAADDVTDGTAAESSQQDDKTTGDKGARNKNVKQLTKEILKLKNTIKEREEDIADCQMKILSLEEQQEKHKEILQSQAALEKLVKKLTEENNDLKKEIENINKDNRTEQQQNISQAHEMMQMEAQKLHQDYTAAINARDARIHELENVLIEYEKQVISYSNTLQQKDKELAEYINQITKLNDVSQKLKSTIDALEEEKSKDQNAEVIKSLNKQIGLYQKTLSDSEDKLRILDEEKSQLASVKAKLENINGNLESELKKVQDLLAEKQSQLQDLQAQQQKHSEELANARLQAKERDEEIHEIKLQLRKESIDNEKLHNIVVQKSNEINDLTKMYEAAKETLNAVSVDKTSHVEQYAALEAKNKELMDKLKKFAASIKKKSAMYSDLENQLHESQKQLQIKNESYEQLLIQVETLPALQEKLKHAEEEFNRLQHLKISLEQRSQEVMALQTDNETLKRNAANDSATVSRLNESIELLNRDLYMLQEENNNYKTQVESLNNKMVECEIDQKNYTNLVTKISCLESELSQKQAHITELLNQVEMNNEKLNQVQYGQDAKVQEREMYIENLQCEIDKYKNRIERLEQCVSTMESTRQSLERKADDLGSQLHEKRKAYNEYMNQEDELITRLAVLMDHDRVVEKQLREIEAENKELRSRGQSLSEEYHALKSAYQALQEKGATLEMKANNVDALESELSMYQNNCRQLDSDLKRITSDHEHLLAQKKRDIEELESEFHTQIEHSVKEKKLLSEKYEKLVEHVSQLETKLDEYRNTIEHLNLNLREMEAENQNLVQKFSSPDKMTAPDYTEQYISEINRLNSLLNSKSMEITEINNSNQLMQTNNLSQISSLESRNMDLSDKYETLLRQVDSLNSEIESLKDNIKQLHQTVSQKDEQIKQLLEKKKLVFEMNIPKTEGLTISSTIEEIDNSQTPFDISSLQSQIISDTQPLHADDQPIVKRSVESVQQHSESHALAEGAIEPTITPKKTYLCYKEEDGAELADSDPFNSDEGWGFGTQEVTEDVIPGLSHLNQQIQELKEANEKLKSELKTTNAKLLKALKKLKDLKAANDVLSNELKISKQISQSSILDMAIESELSSNLKMLETKVEGLSNQLNDEKRDKESVRKQNDVLRQTNERLMETKEKLENELESLKVNYRQVSGKLSTVQWGGDYTNTEVSTVAQSTSRQIANVNPDLESEMNKLEKENDELQSMIDSLNTNNKDLSNERTHLKEEINRLNIQIQEQKQLYDNYESLKIRLEEIQDTNKSLELTNKELKETVNDIEVRYNEAMVNYETLKTALEEKEMYFKNTETELQDKNLKLTEELKSSRVFEDRANSTILELNSELDELKSQLLLAQEKQNAQTPPDVNSLLLSEKYNSMEQHCLDLKTTLEETSIKLQQQQQDNKELQDRVLIQEQENTVLQDKIKEYEVQVNDLTMKFQKLNSENDQLLSTVTELRSSISSAMDQRGFEIAELWKQHLAQREGEFQKIEQDLRTQLGVAESKYEQLLENVQSSSQEETDKIIMTEQINSLQNKLIEKEEHLLSIQNKYAEAVNQLDMLRSEMEDEKVINENKLYVNQEDNDRIINELNKKHAEDCSDLKSQLSALQIELDATKRVNIELGQQLEELHNNYKSQVAEISKQLQLKESEIYQKTHDFTVSLKQRNEEFETVRQQLVDYERKLEDTIYEKESELAILRLKLHERTESYDKINRDLEAEKNSLAESLNEKIIECTSLSKQIAELNRAIEEYADKAAETQIVLESQEIEIVTLKSELSDLNDAFRSARNKIEKHVTFASDTKKGQEADTTHATEKDLLDSVPRAELDLALYMLHQRDVRCEELTMELTQLLEERDTLQLRLSDSIRSYEELKSRYGSSALDASASSSHDSVSELPSFTVEKERPFVDTHRGQSSRSSSFSDPDGEKPKLQAKLSELRTVRHSRDVRLRQDSEHRQLDMRLLQRDVASLPPEAVERLAQAHHTLSRDSQSTPTVLLNWLRGKSTPKVVHM
ncbi:putative viral A-type inclusion protein [Danaus plexippus plexippus]|uniref:Viral A-type inclusion protein n=1 Tax=Danaus plexippus plexippus TaxID=278856 RepID=A0A212FHZ4_DANPL|nr:putative viral A-type inclusion protein [Danaus plexippus plexippus]